MTFRVLVTCDGTPTDRPGMTLHRCRAFTTFPAGTAPELTAALNAAGWMIRHRDRAHLCPSCVRATLSP